MAQPLVRGLSGATVRWGHGWEVGLNREIDAQQRTRMLAERVVRGSLEAINDSQRAAYLRKRCTCGSGLADGLCVNCWPQ